MEKEDLIEKLISEGVLKDKRIITAFRQIKREYFVSKKYEEEAYENVPIQIGYNQTISQPETIAIMLELLDVEKDNKVLEIGAGSGYNAALLSKLAKKVYSVERIPELVKLAKSNLKKSGIRNVVLISSDGSKGYEKEAPYDRIIATCACTEIQDAWKTQLKEGGIIVAPVGTSSRCEMIVAKKYKDGFSYKKSGLFVFVPLIKD